MGDRYYSQTARLVAVICAIFICLTYIMGQMRGVGIVFAQLFGIEIWLGVIIGGSIVFFYAGLGGMKGITYTQVAQYTVMAFAYTLPAVFIAMTLTGNVIPQLGFIGDYQGADGSVPFLEKLNNINTELGFAQYTDGSLSTIDMFCINRRPHVRHRRTAPRHRPFLHRQRRQSRPEIRLLDPLLHRRHLPHRPHRRLLRSRQPHRKTSRHLLRRRPSVDERFRNHRTTRLGR